jgi:tRNA U34 5-carboxymethylaminomethyl modifying GTPase MnmE/TrmE
MTFEELQQVVESTASGLQALSRDVAQLVQAQQSSASGLQALSRDVAQLVQAQQSTQQGLDRLTNLTDRFIDASTVVVARLEQNISELRAGQEQQARVLDYLLRKEQEQQNGEQSDR